LFRTGSISTLQKIRERNKR